MNKKDKNYGNMKNKDMDRNSKEPGNMAMTPKGLRLLLAGLIVMAAGYILMCGGASDDPTVFSYRIFDFQRLVAAPLVIIAGFIVEIAAIMGTGRKK